MSGWTLKTAMAQREGQDLRPGDYRRRGHEAGLDPTKSYQLNQQTGQYDQVGGGGTNVTINPPSAETAAKLGLANGFLDNYDTILKSAQAGEMTGAATSPECS